MLGKLSIRNAKRQAKDYFIYFITIVISVALMFSFNAIAVSEDIIDLSSMMKNFAKAISVISFIIIAVMAWLINYIMKFMIEKRSKEFGTYQILGIEKKDIGNMFTLENIIIGIVAFLVGVAVGIALYQVFTSIIMNIFNQPYKISIVFDIKAVGMTAVYFFGIFLLVLLNNRRKIKKTKVYDLIYADKVNENNIIKTSKGNIIMFIISIVLLIIALISIRDNFMDGSNLSASEIMLEVILIIIGIYMFYRSVSSFMVQWYLKNKSRKYKKDNMFLYRNLTSKINTMSITMATIAFLFTVILIGGNVALLLNDLLNNEIEMEYPFEIMISSSEPDFSLYKDYIEKNARIKEMYEYRIYDIPETSIHKALKNTMFEGRYYNEIDSVIGITDYNKLREMLGYEKIELKDNEVVLQCLKTAEEIFSNYIQQNPVINIANKEFTIKEVMSENLAQVSFNGYTYCIVVPDNFIETIKQQEASIKNEDLQDVDYTANFNYKLVVQTEEQTSEEFYAGLSELIKTEKRDVIAEYNGEKEEYSIEYSLADVRTRGKRSNETKSFFTIISFLAFYVALIFVMASATLLAVQQLSDSEKYKYRYEILKKLGVDELEINGIIFKQLLIYFVLHIIIPIFISIPATIFIGNIFTIAITMQEIWQNIGLVIGMFTLVYGIYFIATDIQFSRNINGDW